MLTKLLELFPQDKEKLYEYAKKQAEREIFLREITETMRSSLDISQVKNIIVNELGKFLNADIFVIRAFDQVRDDFLLVDEYSEYKSSPDIKGVREIEAEIGNVPEKISHGHIKEFFKEHKQIFIPDAVSAYDKLEEPLKILIDTYGAKSVYTIPIYYGDQLLAAFGALYTKEPVNITNENINLLNVLTAQAGIALHQAELYSQAKKQAERETFLRKITEAISGSFDLNEIVSLVCRELPEIFRVQRVVVTEFKTGNDGRISSIHYNTSKDIPSGKDLSKSEHLKAYKYVREVIVDKKRDFIINDLWQSDAPLYYKEIADKLGVKSVLGIPIKDKDKIWGAIFITEFYTPRHWSEEEITLLKTIANQILISIKQTGLYSQIEMRAERESVLRKITENITNSLDINQTKKNIVDETGKLFKADRCLIRLWSDYSLSNAEMGISTEYLRTKHIKSVADIKPDVEFLKYLTSVFLNDGNIYAPDLDNLDTSQAAIKYLKGYGVKSAYASPIYKDDLLIRFLIIQFTKNKVMLSDEDTKLLRTIASQSSIALNQADLYLRAKIQAERADFLRKIIEAVGDSLDLETVLNVICEKIFDLFKPDRVAIENYPDKNDYTKWAVTSQYKSGPDILGVNDIEYSQQSKQYLGTRTLEQGIDIVADDLDESDLPDYFVDTHKKMKIKSFIAVPLKKDNHKWGVLALSQVHRYRKWTNGEIQLLHTVAEQAYIAIRQAELYKEVKESTRLKSEFIANVSHEIRTPLNAIIGFSQLLDNPNCTQEKHHKYINNISLSANHLLKLVSSILDFSKIESGKTKLSYDMFNSKDIIKDVISSIKSMAIQKNITINTELSDVILEADIIKFKQIMINLLSNAIKFTNIDGQVTISTKLKNNELLVEIQDNGIGIAKKDSDKIFKYFSQADSSHTRNQQGSGLGLVLVKKLVELHQGEIGFESQKGKGSKFWFTLPNAK